MSVVIEFGGIEGAGMKSDRVNFSVGSPRRKYRGERAVRSVGFHNKFCVGDPFCKNRSMCELLFQEIKRGTAIAIEVPDGMFAGEPRERDNNVGIAMNEPSIEVTKTQKGLNILNFTRFWPVHNDLNLILGHSESVGGDNKAEVLDTIFVELAFRGRGVKTVFA